LSLFPRPNTVLLVDDSADDGFILKWAFRHADRLKIICILTTGEEALAYFQRVGKYSNHDLFPIPEGLLLDMYLPGLSGIQFLRELTEKRLCRPKRIILLTTDPHPQDIRQAFSLGAQMFQSKAADAGRMKEFVKRLERSLAQEPETFRACSS